MAETAKATGFGVRLPPQPTDEPPLGDWAAEEVPAEAASAEANRDRDHDREPSRPAEPPEPRPAPVVVTPVQPSPEHLAHVAQLDGQLRALEGFAAQFHRDVGQALTTLGQRVDLVARQQESLGLRAKAVELAAPFRDLLSSPTEILPLARSFHEFLIEDQAPPSEAKPEPEPAPEEPPSVPNGEDRTQH